MRACNPDASLKSGESHAKGRLAGIGRTPLRSGPTATGFPALFSERADPGFLYEMS